MTTRMRTGTVTLIVAVCATSSCIGPSPDALTGLATASGGGSVTSGRLAFLVHPSNVAARSPVSPEVKVAAVDTHRNVLRRLGGTLRVELASHPPSGSITGTT